MVPDNVTREQILQLSVDTFLHPLPLCNPDMDWRSRRILLVQAKLSSSTGSCPITSAQENYVRGMPTKRLTCVGNLYCVLGATYIIRDNVDVEKGVANGTLCTLVDIILRPEPTIRPLSLGIDDHLQVHAVSADDVTCLVFKHRTAPWNTYNLYTTLPTGCFPIIPRDKSILCKMGESDTRFRVRVKQLPCDLALALTGHKIQGQTCDQIILGSLSRKHKYGAEGWLYVVLSRVRRISGLHTFVRIDPDRTKYKRRNDVEEEMARLTTIETATMNRISQFQALLPIE